MSQELSPYEQGKIILVDKPLTWTSFDVVKFVRNIIKAKVGHAGTLDPLATGLLILCTGKFTKKIDTIQGMEKEYTGTIALGATRPSYDKETEIDERFDVANIKDEDIISAAAAMCGPLEQIPPKFSAKKINGVPMYQLAREGKDKHIELKSSAVHVYSFTVNNIRKAEDLLYLDFEIKCNKGTYIRSIARDMGLALNSGGYLDSLRRTKIGEYKVEDAHTLEKIKAGSLSIRLPI